MPEEDPRPCHVPEPKECAFAGCALPALSFRNACWDHLEEKERSGFREEIARRAKTESLKGANLFDADLKQAKLFGADLRQANLISADLRGADLLGADLRQTKLGSANMQRTNLGSANMQRADLTGADLQQADLLGADLRQADLWGVLWRGARYLTAEQVGETSEYVGGDWACGKDAYRRLKNYFHEEGLYDDESWAFVMEKTCARKLALEEGRLVPWAALSVWNALAGYGEKWWRALYWATGIIVFFAVLYYPNPWGWGRIALEGRCPLSANDPVRALYFSIVTFATLGFGDLSPMNRWGAVAVMIEVLLGYVMLGTLVALIARKMTR